MINFKTVRWKNFLSTGNTFTEIDLTKNSTTLIIGENGSGKSTLSYTLSGKNGYELIKGDITLDKKSIIDFEPDERAAKGIFL